MDDRRPLGEWYKESRERITALVSDDVGDVAVPATPEWTVHDVVAHLAGIAEDARSGNMAGATTDPWTAAQVERGRSKSTAQLVEQWSADAGGVEWYLSTPEGAANSWRAVLDIHTHEADLQSALGRPVTLPDEVVDWVAALLLDAFHEAVTAASLPRVSVTASPLEVFRSRLGRRTADEARALAWSADPEPYLDHWFVFGRATRTLAER